MLAVSCGALLPIGNWAHWDIHLAEQPEKSIPSYSLLCDEDFLRTYQLKLVEGRDAQTKVTTPGIYSRKPSGRRGDRREPEVRAGKWD